MNSFFTSLAQTLTKSPEHFMKGGTVSTQPVNLKAAIIPAMFFMAFVVLLLKSVIFYYTYNVGVPKIIESVNPRFVKTDFKKISFVTSILIVLLFNSLFG